MNHKTLCICAVWHELYDLLFALLKIDGWTMNTYNNVILIGLQGTLFSVE